MANARNELVTIRRLTVMFDMLLAVVVHIDTQIVDTLKETISNPLDWLWRAADRR